MEGKSVHAARRKQQQLDRKWQVGEEGAAANQVHFDEEEEHEVSADIFEAAVREVLAARMQGEAGCAGLQVLLAGVGNMDEQEMQVCQAGAFEAMDGYVLGPVPGVDVMAKRSQGRVKCEDRLPYYSDSSCSLSLVTCHGRLRDHDSTTREDLGGGARGHNAANEYLGLIERAENGPPRAGANWTEPSSGQ
jgi:hypothetical protein